MVQPGREDVEKAAERLRGSIIQTPLIYSPELSQRSGAEILLKMENLQVTGSFKIRGAVNRVSLLSSAQKQKGVVTASAGNHAQGVALAARRAGIAAQVVMPLYTPVSKVAAVQRLGAKVILHGESYTEAQNEAFRRQQDQGYTFVHAFNEPEVIAGQGTLGLEILDQVSDISGIVVPIGGGGLFSGIGAVAKTASGTKKMFGVQAAACAPVYRLWRGDDSSAVDWTGATIAEGVAVKEPGDITLPLIMRWADDIVQVEEEEIAMAIIFLLEKHKVMVEGAGAVGVSALLAGKLRLEPGGVYAVIISGGNIDINLLNRIIDRGLVESGRLIRFQTRVMDRPGRLKELLQVVASLGANVYTIQHDRLNMDVPLGFSEVELLLETRDQAHAASVERELSKRYPGSRTV